MPIPLTELITGQVTFIWHLSLDIFATVLFPITHFFLWIHMTMTVKPYMELNVGVHNIFKFLRVDYVRRLNYLGLPNVKKNGVRFVLQFDF